MASSETAGAMLAPAVKIETAESSSIASALSGNQSPAYSERSLSPSKPSVVHPRFSRQFGDIFRLLELPSHFMVGHDDMAFLTTKPGDDGFRDITPGPHFLWVQQLASRQERGGSQDQQSDEQHGPAPRCGYWYVTTQTGRIRAKQWDKYNEILGDVASQCETDELKANIESIYPTLRKYQLPDHSRNNTGPPPGLVTQFESPRGAKPSALWQQLTWAISETFLERVTGKKHVHEWLVDSSDCVKGDTHLSVYDRTTGKAYKAAVSSELNFLFAQDFADLDLLDVHPTIQGPDPIAIDTSNRVLALLNNPTANATERDIVAELQFTYLTGTILGNSACLEQWWDLVLKIVLRSWQLVHHRPELCRDLLRTLHSQLIHTAEYLENSGGANDGERMEGLSSEKPIFSTHVKNKWRLERALAIYKRQLNELLLALGDQATVDQQEVGKVFDDLEAWLWKYKWDLRSEKTKIDYGNDSETYEDDEDDDDLLPVVVDLDENGRERGLVSFNDE
ncbi:AAR2 protein-domain-containing protein [Rhypophila decipiens]|uniref:AAR2 protein-domain-containing protein n=1 Tax=Rhypophila decipiens TaxID=261697 RepID=A0AAN6YDQ1_9PEZI|nr:AAR2 protein-domain-containing protein [Rhypophila decipiens]